MGWTCVNNIKKIINKHRFKILNEKDDCWNDRCNCRDKTRCLLNGNCFSKNGKYEAIITNEDKDNVEKYTTVPQNWTEKQMIQPHLHF